MDYSPTKGGHERSKRKLNKSEKEPFSPFRKLRPPRAIPLDAHGRFSLRQMANAQQRRNRTRLKQAVGPVCSGASVLKRQTAPRLLKCARCFRFLIKTPSFAKLVSREGKMSLGHGLSSINVCAPQSPPHSLQEVDFFAKEVTHCKRFLGVVSRERPPLRLYRTGERKHECVREMFHSVPETISVPA